MIFGLFKKKPTVTRSEPKVELCPSVKGVQMPSRLDCASEANQALGYLRPGAGEVIADMIEEVMVNHPRLTATTYRKAGEQVSDAEKKALGVRRNGFLSQSAPGDLTEKGRIKPLDAHEVTLRRATFSFHRVRTIRQGWEHGYDEFEHSSFDPTCPACDALDKKITSGADAQVFPPSGCICETGRFGLTIHIDYIAELVDRERQGTNRVAGLRKSARDKG